jgi:hypothetical protein
MDAHDLLLYWLSDRQAAGGSTVAHACRELAERFGLTPPGRDERARRQGQRRALIGSLHRLGHVECQLSPLRWFVTAPTLVWGRGSDNGEGVLYGARSPALETWLRRRFGDCFQQAEQERGPRRWAIQGQRAEVERTLADAPWRIAVVEERGTELLACLPCLEEALVYQGRYVTADTMQSWQQCVFTPSGRRLWQWHDQPGHEDGLYRERGPGRCRWFHLHGGQAALLETPEKRLLGWWLERARAGGCAPRYDAVERTLDVPRGLPLPVLLDRGLRLASGLSPTLAQVGAGGRFWRYGRIDAERARQALRILGAVEKGA